MVNSVVEEVRARGCRALRLDTYVKNTPARELYRSPGFTGLGEHALHNEGTDLSRFHSFELIIYPCPLPSAYASTHRTTYG
ncbi:GNAT family N-acetyltransferase [Streptomyces sp. CFMR 7]|uniref:GNAT family N-acetyltransferase n=1 Tax=Streptomyces sp. CFMR 7 TaxID=1649184 RepID=UPI0037D9B058